MFGFHLTGFALFCDREKQRMDHPSLFLMVEKSVMHSLMNGWRRYVKPDQQQEHEPFSEFLFSVMHSR